ncbi:fasciclin domain-containing protein [Flavihumibacter rivuli]|uniref:fasciclin domain-containing protein n=1 Tax=Flavihumibacter rivuli TaxID=2838156 RepID=UPI001BDEDA30|nr:fasciclin domain-containing protein [Flavihumibacter rivuli]ULQ55501.1 fasciclin domain-containing protein [Flavihumibacter rivuli]
MLRIKNTIIIMVLAAVTFVSCKRDEYFIGGSTHSAKVDMTTYDYLKSHPQGLFDTLLLLVDKAGVKEKINKPGITFFAPTDYAVNSYLSKRVKEEQNIDPFRQWTIDSMIKYELPKFADSIDTYIIAEELGYDKLTKNGKKYNTMHPGTQSVVSYEETRDPSLGYNPNVSTIPRIVYYTLLFEDIPPPIVAPEIPSEQGKRERVQTSGIQSNTGTIMVLNNAHSLFFRK